MRQDETAGDPAAWHDRAVDLLERFDHAGQASDLEGAIGLLHRVVDAIPADEPNRPHTLFNLGSAYLRRFDTVTNAQEDLEEAIAFLREGAPALTARFPDRLDSLDVLVMALHSWFEHTGDRRMMNEAAEVSWRVCQATSKRDPLYVARLFMLAQAMNLRATGRDRQDADQAVEVSRRLVAAPADRHVTRNVRLHLQAGALMIRATVAHQLDDAREAIQVYAEAAKSAKKRDPQRWEHLVGSALAYRAYLEMGWWDEADRVTLAEGAIRAVRDAVKAAPGTSERAEAKVLLVEALLSRSLATHSGSDAAEAVRVAQQAVQDSRGDDELHPEAVFQLGNALHLRFRHARSRADIDESVSILRQAAGLDAEHGRWLGNSLRTRFEHFGQASDAAEAVELFRRVSSSPEVPTPVRVDAARDWGNLAAAAGDKDEAVAGYTAAVRLLPMLAEHGTEQAIREHKISQQRGLARDAAEAALDTGRPELAVELLEQGRSVLWSQALRLRTDLSALSRAAPDLAARLKQVRLDLAENTSRVPMAAVPGDADARRNRVPGRLRQLSREWDSLVAEARDVPGFDNFLGPPTFAELRAAAEHGPVVLINAGKRRCDALAVTPHGVVTIPLPSARDAEEQADTWLTAQVDAETMGASGLAHAREALVKLLGWLWERVTGPVLDALGYASAPSDRARWPRVWWCPTGLLASLPLHASGAVPDRVVSSYTPTLGHLIRARSQPVPAAPGVLAVGMPHTPGQNPLPAVPYELEMVEQALAVGSGHGIDVRLIGEQAHRSAVLAALRAHEWAHVACHGDQSWFQPGRGAVYLHDGKLTVREIGAQQAPNADLAFLSACRTAEGGVNLDDEGLTLATALHVSGYRHIVATLWPIRDDLAPTIARAFYEGITSSGRRDATRAGEALHHAIGGVRAMYPDDPLLWASYVHIGP